MACELSKHGVLVAIHKHYTVEQWTEFAKNHPDVTVPLIPHLFTHSVLIRWFPLWLSALAPPLLIWRRWRRYEGSML